MLIPVREFASRMLESKLENNSQQTSFSSSSSSFTPLDNIPFYFPYSSEESVSITEFYNNWGRRKPNMTEPAKENQVLNNMLTILLDAVEDYGSEETNIITNSDFVNGANVKTNLKLEIISNYIHDNNKNLTQCLSNIDYAIITFNLLSDCVCAKINIDQINIFPGLEFKIEDYVKLVHINTYYGKNIDNFFRIFVGPKDYQSATSIVNQLLHSFEMKDNVFSVLRSYFEYSKICNKRDQMFKALDVQFHKDLELVLLYSNDGYGYLVPSKDSSVNDGVLPLSLSSEISNNNNSFGADTNFGPDTNFDLQTNFCDELDLTGTSDYLYNIKQYDKYRLSSVIDYSFEDTQQYLNFQLPQMKWELQNHIVRKILERQNQKYTITIQEERINNILKLFINFQNEINFVLEGYEHFDIRRIFILLAADFGQCALIKLVKILGQKENINRIFMDYLIKNMSLFQGCINFLAVNGMIRFDLLFRCCTEQRSDCCAEILKSYLDSENVTHNQDEKMLIAAKFKDLRNAYCFVDVDELQEKKHKIERFLDYVEDKIKSDLLLEDDKMRKSYWEC